MTSDRDAEPARAPDRDAEPARTPDRDAAPTGGGVDPDGAGDAAPAEARKRRPTPGKAFWGRFALGHFLAYPVCFLTAAGALPLAMMVRKDELLSPGRTGARSSILQDVARDLKLTGIEAAQVEIVLEVAMWACMAVLILMHIGVLPWAFAAARAVRHPEGGGAGVKRGLRIFVWIVATTVVTVAVGGTAGWIYVLSR